MIASLLSWSLTFPTVMTPIHKHKTKNCTLFQKLKAKQNTEKNDYLSRCCPRKNYQTVASMIFMISCLVFALMYRYSMSFSSQFSSILASELHKFKTLRLFCQLLSQKVRITYKTSLPASIDSSLQGKDHCAYNSNTR